MKINILLKILIGVIDKLAPFFYYIVYIFYLLYVGLYFGLDKEYAQYVMPLKTSIRLFIGAFLILHFNPLIKKNILTDLDINILMSSGLIIILDAGLSAYIDKTLTKIDIKI